MLAPWGTNKTHSVTQSLTLSLTHALSPFIPCCPSHSPPYFFQSIWKIYFPLLGRSMFPPLESSSLPNPSGSINCSLIIIYITVNITYRWIHAIKKEGQHTSRDSLGSLEVRMDHQERGQDHRTQPEEWVSPFIWKSSLFTLQLFGS